MTLGPANPPLKPAYTSTPEGEELSAFYDRVLAPFEDEQLFYTQLFADSSYLRKHPELRGDIQTMVQTDDDQSIVDLIEILDLSRQVDSPANQTPFRAIIAQLNLSREINDLKIAVTGMDGSTTRVNALMNLLMRKFVDAIPDDQLHLYDETVRFIAEKIKTVKTFQGNQRSWFSVKNENIINFIDQRILLEEYFDGMPDKDPSSVSPEQVDSDTETISALFNQARENQRYGVKIGYKEQDYRPGSLVFSPPMDIKAELASANHAHPLMLSKGENYIVALVVDSDKKSFNKKIAYRETVSEAGRLQAGLNVQAREMFILLDNGELSSFHTDLDFAQIAAKRGAYNAYRQLQAEILAGYIDLTSDLDVSLAAKGIKAPKTGESNYSDQSGTDIVRHLLVPRIKASKQEGSDNNTGREVRLHGVVWHIRRLPEGWHATPEAQALADEAHIKLEDGETFVRAHQRGSKSLGEVVTHSLVNR